MARIIRTRSGEVTNHLPDLVASRRGALARAPSPQPAIAQPVRRTPPVTRAARATVGIPTPKVRAPVPEATVELPDDATVIMDILQRARYEPRPARTGKYLHVSDLLSKCLRKIAIIEKHKLTPAPQKLSLMDSLTFDVGDVIHDVIKGRVVNGSPAQVWGNWKCLCGCTKTTTPSTFHEIEQAECPSCKSHLTKYVEVPMLDDELDIVGTPDLLLLLSEFNAFFVSELKSISADQWEELVRPKPDHVLQVLMYWYLMRKLGYKLVNRVSVVYVTKGYKFKGSPCKEFSFKPEESLHRLDMYLEMARELKEARQNGTLPARTHCVTDRTPDAKQCEVCSICFGGANAVPVKISAAQALRRTAAPVRR